MSSPFDFVRSFTTTKESLYTKEALFVSEYVPFIVNRALSNDPKCTLFADALNVYPDLDLKLQHDFYLYGIPKMRTGKMWSKKEEDDTYSIDDVKLVAKDLNVSIRRAYQLMPLIDSDDIDKLRSAEGGKVGRK